MSFSEERAKKSLALAVKLQKNGIDYNQVASQVAASDPGSANYGIGLMMGGDGRPLPENRLMLEALKDLAVPGPSAYRSVTNLMPIVKEKLLMWLCVPDKYWEDFILACPSDGGTGAVQAGLQALLMVSNLRSINVSQKGWPAYRAMAAVSRVQFCEREYEHIPLSHSLPIAQLGPHNQTGLLPTKTMKCLAEHCARNGLVCLCDMAYPGFSISPDGHNDVMPETFRVFMEPFLKNNVPTAFAVGFTKRFRLFATRPFGALLVYAPRSRNVRNNLQQAINQVMRARGASFSNAANMALLNVLIKDFSGFVESGQMSLQRLNHVEERWRKMTIGTSLKPYFGDDYGGLFRLLPARHEAAKQLYGRGIVPVISKGFFRINITGLPDDDEAAEFHVRSFADVVAED